MSPSKAEVEAVAKRLKGVDWRPGCLMEQAASMMRAVVKQRDALAEEKRRAADDLEGEGRA